MTDLLNSPEQKHESSPVNLWFGLTYSAYLVLPRMAMQAMPTDWQKRFVALMDEAEEIGIETPSYKVLNEDPEYTTVEKYDEDDEYSRDYHFTALRTDPWSNYRRPDYSLLPEKLRPKKDSL